MLVYQLPRPTKNSFTSSIAFTNLQHYGWLQSIFLRHQPGSGVGQVELHRANKNRRQMAPANLPTSTNSTYCTTCWDMIPRYKLCDTFRPLQHTSNEMYTLALNHAKLLKTALKTTEVDMVSNRPIQSLLWSQNKTVSLGEYSAGIWSIWAWGI